MRCMWEYIQDIDNPLSYFSFQPVLHDCHKGRGMCYPVCGMVHIKEPLCVCVCMWRVFVRGVYVCDVFVCMWCVCLLYVMCVCVCMYVMCVFVCMYVMDISVYVCLFICMYVCIYVCCFVFNVCLFIMYVLFQSPFMDEIPPPPEQDLMGTPG